MSDDQPPPRRPRSIKRSVQDKIVMSDDVTGLLDLTRSVGDKVSMAESVQAVVGQAQAQIATAIGQAHDATVRIEEFGAGATTAQERDLAVQLATDNEATISVLTSIAKTLEGIRSDATESGKSTTLYNRATLVTNVIVALGTVVIVLLSLKITGTI